MGVAYMDKGLKEHMESCEIEMTFEELKILREIAMKTVAETEAAAKVQFQTTNCLCYM